MTDWAKLKVVDLRAELKSRGLSSAGLKGELVARLQEDDSGHDESTQAMEGVEDARHDETSEHKDPVGAHGQDQDPVETANQSAADEVDLPGGAQAEPEPAQHEKQHEPAQAVAIGTTDAVAEPTPANPEPVPTSAVVNQSPQPPVSETQQLDSPPAPTAEDAATTMDSAQAVQQPATDKAPDEPRDMAEPVPEPAPQPASEPTTETNKRKRRSMSPPPVEDDISRKRARADGESDIKEGGNAIAPDVKYVDEATTVVSITDHGKDHDMQDAGPVDATPANMNPALEDEIQNEAEDAPAVAPAVHPATSALYISNLMRPLRPQDARSYLVGLATRSGEPTNNSIIQEFFLDQIRTHAFVIFDSVTAASRVRALLHDHVWPNESNRKPLKVDFIPPEKVAEWIETEETSSDRRVTRWEVVYKDGPDGSVQAQLESASRTASLAGPPPAASSRPPLPTFGGPNSIPIGPRGYREPGQAVPPTGPRAKRPGAGPGPRPPPFPTHHDGGGNMERTRAHPTVAYQTVSDDLARRRLSNMRSFYTADKRRRLGREINRYSFEDGDSFVDRGKEIFEGIRPPHRERERRRGGGAPRGPGGSGPPSRGGGRARRGGPPFRPRSDRYLPGADSGRWSPPRSRDNRDSHHSRDYRDRR